MPEERAYFGNPSITRQGRRAGATVEQPSDYRPEHNALTAALAGFLGSAPDELGGSVLDGSRQRNERNAAVPFAIGSALNIVPSLGALNAAGVGGRGAAQASKLASQRGAIRIGGDEDLILSHAFPSHSAGSIAKQGELISPSLGITSKMPNDYAPRNPAFLFKAGAVDPEKLGGAIVNRDGYFGNPTGLIYKSASLDEMAGLDKQGLEALFAKYADKVYDPVEHIQQISDMVEKARKRFGASDLRLLQSMPEPGQAMAIASSPNFKNFKDFEQSLLGAKLLRNYREGPLEAERAWVNFNNKMGNVADEADVENLYRMMNQKKSLKGAPLPQQKAWQESQSLPSAMAEYKSMQNIPVNPDNAVVYVPNTTRWDEFEKLASLRDAGFKFVSSEELVKGSEYGASQARIGQGMADMLPSTGGFKMPPSLKGNMDFFDSNKYYQWLDANK